MADVERVKRENEIQVCIEDEMRSSYIDYAMSVIIGRALPDVRDGLKPVHRRILFAQHQMGNVYNKPYKKSARVVGDVIGKFHPHGDQAVYDTMVRMAQDFSMRYPLLDGQGNFGSLDGDPPAAMRYTEVRMARIASEFMADIDKETVDFGRNYDDSLDEPLVLPSRIPNLLINGSDGIAVGMATRIPPHNLGEIIDALLFMIENRDAEDDEILKIVKGPDFPTGGIIYGAKGIKDAYRTGRGKLTVRARAMIEATGKGDRKAIVITEIPFQVNKARLIESIADLVKNKKIDGITDLRDESDKEGVRVVIELRRDVIPAVVLNQLFAHTQLQVTFGVIMLALVNNRPRVLNLREALEQFLGFRKEVVTRRTVFELRQARHRAHLLEGLKIALDHLDEVISTIRKSKNPEIAKGALVKKFSFTPIQAQAILEMRLQRLTALEREKILSDYRETLKLIERLSAILSNERLVYQVVADELKEIRDRYADDRRTEIVHQTAEIKLEDLIQEEDMVVTISHNGYVKRNPVSVYRSQARGGKGKVGMKTRDEDFVNQVFVASTHSYLLIFSDKGKVYWLKVHEIPQAGRTAKGKAIVNLVRMSGDDRVAAVLPVRSFEEGGYVVLATAKGLIKKTELSAFSNPRSTGIIACTIEPDDELIAAELTTGENEILLGTRDGMAIRFKESEVRPMGRSAKGVRGITLRKGDRLVGMAIVESGRTVLTVTERGYGKRSVTDEYRVQSRGGKGIIQVKCTEKNGKVCGFVQVADGDDIMIITDKGKLIRLNAKAIRVIGRNTQGVRLISLDNDEKVSGIAKVVEEENGT